MLDGGHRDGLKDDKFNYLLSCPELLWFENGWRQQFNSASLVSQSPVNQLGVLGFGEETASYGHPRT